MHRSEPQARHQMSLLLFLTRSRTLFAFKTGGSRTSTVALLTVETPSKEKGEWEMQHGRSRRCCGVPFWQHCCAASHFLQCVNMNGIEECHYLTCLTAFYTRRSKSWRKAAHSWRVYANVVRLPSINCSWGLNKWRGGEGGLVVRGGKVWQRCWCVGKAARKFQTGREVCIAGEMMLLYSIFLRRAAKWKYNVPAGAACEWVTLCARFLVGRTKASRSPTLCSPAGYR